MRSFTTIVSALALATALTGCVGSRVAFTGEVRSQYKLSDDEVKNLQFYNSDTITLRRELNATDRQVSGGHRLVLTSGRVVEEVVVEKETPGVAVALTRDTIAVSFDLGSQLEFSLRTGEVVSPPGPIEPDRRFAQAPDPFPGESRPTYEHTPEVEGLLGQYFLRRQPDSSLVLFQGQLFEPREGYSAYLMIDQDKLDDVVENRTVLPGRTLDADANIRPRIRL